MLGFLFGKPSQDKFARLMMTAVRQAGREGRIDYDRDEFRLLLGEGEEDAYFFLSNAYQDYCNAPRKYRREVLQRYATIWGAEPETPPDNFDEARDKLLPKVRDRFWYQSVRLKQQTLGSTQLDSPELLLSDHLSVSLVYDLPSSMMTVSQDQLDTWGVTLEEALAVARDNMWNISNESFIEIAPGVYVSPWQDNHDASRLYLYDLIWQLDVPGRHVALAVHRDILIVTGDQNRDGLRMIANIAQKPLQDARRISGVPVRLNDRTWETFTPDQGYNEIEELRKLYIEFTAAEYNEQKALLDGINQQAGKDIFLPTAMLTEERQTGRVSSVAVWGEGVESLLPRTEEIQLMAEADINRDELEPIPWAEAFEKYGHLMKPVEMYPVRYHVDSFPANTKV